jgi:hypothetical protein
VHPGWVHEIHGYFAPEHSHSSPHVNFVLGRVLARNMGARSRFRNQENCTPGLLKSDTPLRDWARERKRCIAKANYPRLYDRN